MAKNNWRIKHELLGVSTTKEQIAKLCEEAIDSKFSSVYVNLDQIPWAKKFLSGSRVKISTIIGYPSGLQDTATKLYDAQKALNLGADEINLVINTKAFKNGDYGSVEQELVDMRKLTQGHVFTVIIATDHLSDEEIVTVIQLATEANADFVQTTSDFAKEQTSLSEEIVLVENQAKTQPEIRDSKENAGSEKDSGILIMQTTRRNKKK